MNKDKNIKYNNFIILKCNDFVHIQNLNFQRYQYTFFMFVFSLILIRSSNWLKKKLRFEWNW